MKHLIFLSIAVLVISGCRKDSSDPESLLIEKTWTPSLKDLTPGTNSGGEILYYPVKDCERDDSYKFQADGKLTKTYGRQKCAEGEPGSETVGYSIDIQAGQIIINGIKYKLLDLSEKQLKYSAALSGGGNVVYMFQH